MQNDFKMSGRILVSLSDCQAKKTPRTLQRVDIKQTQPPENVESADWCFHEADFRCM